MKEVQKNGQQLEKIQRPEEKLFWKKKLFAMLA